MIDFSKKKTIVIKIGSNILTDKDHNLDLNNLRSLVKQIAFLRGQGKRVVVVSSGAIVCGAQKLGIVPESIAEKQAAAAVGQVVLMEYYQQFFIREGSRIGQILLTKDTFENSDRSKHAKNTMNKLVEMGIVPIVNENDTVSIDEIKFSDNDNLSSLVSILVEADLQIFLTDIDGLYDLDPTKNDQAVLIKQLTTISDNFLAGLSSETSGKGKGGMKSKVQSAKYLLDNNIEVIITNGRKKNILKDLIAGKDFGTFFLNKEAN